MSTLTFFRSGCEGEVEVDQRDPTGWGERENNKQKREREKAKPKDIHKGDVLKAAGWLLGSASR
jgi:hypothetical protein